MKRIPVIEVDLSLPPKERWSHLPKYLRRVGGTLARRSVEELGDTKLQRLAGWLIDTCTAVRNPYRAEIGVLARLCGISRHEALTANFSYEIQQIAHYGFHVWEQHAPRIADLYGKAVSSGNAAGRWLGTLRESPHACTAGAAYFEKLGMTLVRSMDWDLPGLGRHTVIFHCRNAPAGDYYNVAWPGYCGVLSGMAPGRFAATINQAFPFTMPSLQWPPSHLLRWCFENCDSYADALATLEGTPVCFPAFVMLVGSRPGEAAVVELTPRRNVVHRMNRRRSVAIANDYLTGEWRTAFRLSGNTVKPHEKGEWCEHRRNRMLNELNRRRPRTIERALASIQTDWIDNECTMQQMAFMPATGEFMVIGIEDQAPVVTGTIGA
jgi:hypothetical protein